MGLTAEEWQLIQAYRRANKMYKAVALELLQTHPEEAIPAQVQRQPEPSVIDLQSYRKEAKE